MTFNQDHFYVIDEKYMSMQSFLCHYSQFLTNMPSIAEIHFFKMIEICDVFGFQKEGWLWGGLADF